MAPLITLKKIDISPVSGEDKRADDQRIRNALALEPLEIPLSVLRKLPSRGGKELSCVIGAGRHGYKLIDPASEGSYSIALDLGTTNIVSALYDNVSQRAVAEVKIENPQIIFGSDILTRMHYSMLGRYDDLNRSLIEGVNESIRKLCERAGIRGENIHALVVAGNTVMSHFFLGLDVSGIPVEPFVPVVRKPGFFNASELGLAINREALVYIFPNSGSYVGGDIVAGILASGIFDSDEASILIDVGTNAEIVIGNRDWLLVGAGAAGPALEEGISGIGRRAERGIIYDVEIRDGGIECRTFDNAAPEGVCGSGMVSLIYEMYMHGIIGSDGVLSAAHKGVLTRDGERVFNIMGGEEDGLVIKQTEIENFLRSKAAMFTLLLVLLRSVGLEFSDIRKVYVAGALGNGINVKKAVGIGMLPDWPHNRIVPIGNASIKGARMVLENRGLLDREDEITDSITYKHMHDDPEFMKEFRGAIFIPHTTPGLLRI